MSSPSSLAVATRAYPFRPSRAWIRACMLEAYAALRPGLDHPVADLGCGDGQFAQALVELGLLDAVDVGLDFLLADLQAMRPPPRLGRVRGDLVHLPLADRSCGTVMCNTVLSSFLGGDLHGLDRALAEIHRILRPRGALLAGVGTPQFTANLMLARLLRSLGARAGAEAYARSVNRRHDHTVLLDVADWEERFARAGLTVERRAFFGRPAHADGYAWLCLLNPLALLKLARSPTLAGKAGRGFDAALHERLAVTLRRQPVDDPRGAEDAGFVVLLARRRD